MRGEGESFFLKKETERGSFFFFFKEMRSRQGVGR